METFTEYLKFIEETEKNEEIPIINADGIPMAPMPDPTTPEPGCIFDLYEV